MTTHYWLPMKMHLRNSARVGWRTAVVCLPSMLLVACGGSNNNTPVAPAPPTPPNNPPPAVNGPAWWGYARDSQHAATGAIATQSLQRVLWQTSVDLAPQRQGGSLLAHYGSPVI